MRDSADLFIGFGTISLLLGLSRVSGSEMEGSFGLIFWAWLSSNGSAL
jgi:hypothetical protein